MLTKKLLTAKPSPSKTGNVWNPPGSIIGPFSAKLDSFMVDILDCTLTVEFIDGLPVYSGKSKLGFTVTVQGGIGELYAIVNGGLASVWYGANGRVYYAT